MPRPLREQLADAIYHVTNSGVDGSAIVADDADRLAFLSFLRGALDRSEWRCIAFCLMNTHYHLLLETTRPNLAAGMQWLNSRYATAFNVRHQRRGHLFGQRYYADPVDGEEHFAAVLDYIAQNPVRAGLCEGPEDWPWSSFSGRIA